MGSEGLLEPVDPLEKGPGCGLGRGLGCGLGWSLGGLGLGPGLGPGLGKLGLGWLGPGWGLAGPWLGPGWSHMSPGYLRTFPGGPRKPQEDAEVAEATLFGIVWGP